MGVKLLLKTRCAGSTSPDVQHGKAKLAGVDGRHPGTSADMTCFKTLCFDNCFVWCERTGSGDFPGHRPDVVCRLCMSSLPQAISNQCGTAAHCFEPKLECVQISGVFHGIDSAMDGQVCNSNL